MKNSPTKLYQDKEKEIVDDANLISNYHGVRKVYKQKNNDQIPIKPFKSQETMNVELNSSKETFNKEPKIEKFKRKRQIGDDFRQDAKPAISKKSKYNPSELMHKLEEFSEVWNDCPNVQNPKQDYKNWIGRNNDKLTNEKVQKGNGRITKYYNSESLLKDKSSSLNAAYEKKQVNRKDRSTQDSNTKHFASNKTEIQVGISQENLFDNTETNYVMGEMKNQREKYDSKLDDLKRQKAVQEQRQLRVDHKNIIKQALSSLDGKQQVNKKFIFSDDEDLEKNIENKRNNVELKGSTPERRQTLFNDGDLSESEYVLNLNRQFEGKKGQKLLELQSKFANDSRFALDTRFYESGSELSENESPSNTDQSNEKKKQLAILESIVNHQIKPLSEIKKASAKQNEEKFLLRFDPSREDHTKYIMKPPELTILDEKVKEKKKKKQTLNGVKSVTSTNVQENKLQVSSEKFYTVKEDLKEVLKKENKAEFSLLKLFGPKEEIQDQSHEKSQSVKKLKHATKNPFTHDSSESEPEEKELKTGKAEDISPVLVSSVSWRTTFFFTEKDPRLLEALEFLKGPDETEDTKEYAEKRKILKDFIKHKFKNSNRKKSIFKKKLGGIKKRVFKKRKTN